MSLLHSCIYRQIKLRQNILLMMTQKCLYMSWLIWTLQCWCGGFHWLRLFHYIVWVLSRLKIWNWGPCHWNFLSKFIGSVLRDFPNLVQVKQIVTQLQSIQDLTSTLMIASEQPTWLSRLILSKQAEKHQWCRSVNRGIVTKRLTKLLIRLKCKVVATGSLSI